MDTSRIEKLEEDLQPVRPFRKAIQITIRRGDEVLPDSEMVVGRWRTLPDGTLIRGRWPKGDRFFGRHTDSVSDDRAQLNPANPSPVGVSGSALTANDRGMSPPSQQMEEK